MEKYKNISDNEIISMLGEADENINNIIYAKYSYLIDSLIKKYQNFVITLHIDKDELYSEASLAFSDGIRKFNIDKNASLKTFLTVCIERKIINIIHKNTTKKYQKERLFLSLDYLNEYGVNLYNYFSKDDDPLKDLTEIETYDEIIGFAKNNLSSLEYEVFLYRVSNVSYKTIASLLDKTPKQIDNTLQRIKMKMEIIMKKYCK